MADPEGRVGMGASLSEFQTKILPKVFVRGGLTHAHATSPVCVVFDVARVPARKGAIKLLD